MLLYQALQEKRNENVFEAFLKMLGSFQKYINEKMCSAQFIQPRISLLEKSICGGQF